MPIFNSAKDAIKTIKDDEIFELKSYQKVSKGVLMVMTSICIIFGIQPIMVNNKEPDYWKASQKHLLVKAKTIKEMLLGLKPEDIDAKAIKKVRDVYLSKPGFNYKDIKKKSLPCGSFCQWVIAVSNLEHAYKKIKPMMESLKQAEETAENAK